MIKHILGRNTQSKITGIKEDSIQPNAVDVTLADVWKILSSDFYLFDKEKTNRLKEKVKDDDGRAYKLEEGVYEISFENEVTVGPNETGLIIRRSTLVRNGVFIYSGLYDSGYHGMMVASLQVTSGTFYVMRGTRLAQFVVFDAESLHQYMGVYGIDEQGNIKQEQKRYS
jgi:deoxycytidine triphosphate deaminase